MTKNQQPGTRTWYLRIIMAWELLSYIVGQFTVGNKWWAHTWNIVITIIIITVLDYNCSKTNREKRKTDNETQIVKLDHWQRAGEVAGFSEVLESTSVFLNFFMPSYWYSWTRGSIMEWQLNTRFVPCM